MLDEILFPIKAELGEVDSILSTQVKSNVALINDALQYITKNIGKRIRPAVFLLSAKMLGNVNKEMLYLACVFELIHTASLLHDDVIDDADLRRGKPSVKARWGNQISILLGDFLWCKSSEFLMAYGSKELWGKVINVVSDITEGQIKELTCLNNIELDEDGYMDIIKGKTAALFQVCAQGAAIEQKLSQQFVDALQQYGFNLGMAFQLKDDILDYVSDDDLLGKRAGNDLKEGKLTLPIIYTLKQCDKNQAIKIKEFLISRQISSSQFKDVRDIINNYEGLKSTQELAISYIAKAKSYLSIFKPCLEKDTLSRLADYVVKREV